VGTRSLAQTLTTLIDLPTREAPVRAPPGSISKVASLLAALVLAGCGGKGSGSANTHILDGRAENVSFPEVRQAIDRLYRDRPGVDSFVSRQVQYTVKTRDKVLRVCRQGVREGVPRERESSRVFACAPLIFFFYSYGVHKSVSESRDVARKLYWYTIRHNQRPYDSRPVLTPLLRRWGIE
jgi:hypothetical protein